MVKPTMNLMDWLRKRVEEADTELLREMVGCMADALMSADASAVCNVSYNERDPERTNSRNGY